VEQITACALWRSRSLPQAEYRLHLHIRKLAGLLIVGGGLTATGLRNRLETDTPGGDERDGGSRGGITSLAAGDSG
jgi:hypothetical protein